MFSQDVTGPHWATQLTTGGREQRLFGKTVSDDIPFQWTIPGFGVYLHWEHYQFC